MASARKSSIGTGTKTITPVLAVVALSVVTGSVVADDADAEAISAAVCENGTLTMMVAERGVAGAVAPAQVHAIGAAVVQMPPPLAVADTKVVPAGGFTVMTTSCASARPPLSAVTK